MKDSKAFLAIIGIVLIPAILGGLIYLVANSFLTHDASTQECKAIGKHYFVTIQGDVFSDRQVNAHKCDSLTITNNDDKVRNIAFGQHDKHETYDGVTEKVLQHGGSLTITLNKTGTYEVHDHLQDETQAFFSVSP